MLQRRTPSNARSHKYNKTATKLEQHRYRAAHLQLQLASAAAAGGKTLASKLSVCSYYDFMLSFCYFFELTVFYFFPASIIAHCFCVRTRVCTAAGLFIRKACVLRKHKTRITHTAIHMYEKYSHTHTHTSH